MPVTKNNQVLFHDGEGVVYTDFNDLQAYLRSLVVDQLFGSNLQTHPNDRFPPVNDVSPVGRWDNTRFPSGFCYAPKASHCFPDGTVNNREVTNSEGLLLQYSGTAEPDGITPKLLAYRFDAGELLTELDAGDATNPRWDLIAIKLEEVDGDTQSRDFEDAATRVVTSQSFDKLRRVTFDKVVVKGTPASTPTRPNCPSGYVPWAMVYVEANWNTSLNVSADLHDMRIPLGVRRVVIPGYQLAPGSWTPSGLLSMGLTASNSAQACGLMAPLGPESRILGLSVDGTISNGDLLILAWHADGSGLVDGTVFESITNSFTGGTLNPVWFFDGNMYWGGGTHCYASHKQGLGQAAYFGIQINSGANGDDVRGVTLFVAG